MAAAAALTAAGQRVLTGHRITSGQFMHRAQK